MKPLHWQALARYLQQAGYTLDVDAGARTLSGGSANRNYAIVLEGKKAVLRCPPEGPLPPGANDVAREYRVLSSLGEHYRLAPRGLHYCEDTSVIGVPFCISEFREGICIGRQLPATLQQRQNVGDSLSRLLVTSLVALHSVDLDATGLTDLGNAQGFVERQIAGWYKRGSRVLSESQLEKLSAVKTWLAQNLPDDRPAGVLVHNDFKLDNMLVDEDSLSATAVVDWDMCTVGDPLFELAILLSYWGGQDDSYVYDYQCRMPKEAQGWWRRDQVVSEYRALSGRHITAPTLHFYWWLAQYRNAVVYAQLDALFQRTGEYPAALTRTACETMAEFVDELINTLSRSVGSGEIPA